MRTSPNHNPSRSLSARICASFDIAAAFARGAGFRGGAEHWAVIASLIESCKLLGVEPHGYLADVITRIVNDHPQTRLDDLLPWEYPVTRQLQVVA